jgi:hypothetical protein
MVKKILVKDIEAVVKGLKEEGLDVTRADLMPSELNTYYTLAISANWNGLRGIERHRFIWNKISQIVPINLQKYIQNIYTYNRPEDIEADMPLFAQWEPKMANVGVSLM